MSNPMRSRQRFPFRTAVHIIPNANARDRTLSRIVLAPITQEIRPLEQENDPLTSRPLLKPNPIVVTSATPRVTPSPRVLDFWPRLREHLAREPSANPTDHGKQKTPNKVVRIFVSSTFTDFFNEREVLIKKVFPALRERMESTGIQIIDCDLRWGVPKDSTTEQTILSCLEELDRCFEDNGQPFFIGLVSDKYGWVPDMGQLPSHITERYRWIDGASITLMEFIHGAFRTRNPNACFLVRKSGSLLQNLPEKFRNKFVDIDDYNRQQVQELRHQLSEILPDGHVFEYDCFYNGIDTSTGRERIKIDGLQEFERQALAFLTRAIEQWYPGNFVEENQSNSEQEQDKTFLINKTQFAVDRPDEFSVLLNYISGNSKDLTLINGNDSHHTMDANKQPMLALIGRSGDGKTMLLSQLVLMLEGQEHQKYLIFHYMVDNSVHAYPSNAMLEGLTRKLEKFIDDNNLMSPITGQRLNRMDEKFLSQAVSILPVPLILIIDGLERGDLHHQRNYLHQFPFSHLSELFSERTFLIVSCETNLSLHQTIQTYTHYKLELLPFSNQQRQQYIETFFRRFNKTLESEQASLLLTNVGGEHPMYLAYVCENLRQFGDYSLVTQRLKTYPQTLDKLLDLLLDEVYTSADSRSIVDGFFKLLLVSNVGILETDIVRMLQTYLINNNNNGTNPETITISSMTWSTLRRQIKTFLDTTWIQGYQVIIFRHASFEQKLHQRVLKQDTDEMRSLHRFMADFFTKHASIQQHANLRIPYHYEQARMNKELVTYLRSQQSHDVSRVDRQTYLRKLRCSKPVLGNDGPLNQRAYLCHICAMQFRLGPFTMAKSSCLICANMILGGNMMQTSPFKREARLCPKHGSPGYPHSIQCVLCKMIQPKPTGKTPSFAEPVPVNICFECAFSSGPVLSRCCGLELE